MSTVCPSVAMTRLTMGSSRKDCPSAAPRCPPVLVLVRHQAGQHQQPVPVLQGGDHGVAVHADEPDGEGEQITTTASTEQTSAWAHSYRSGPPAFSAPLPEPRSRAPVFHASSTSQKPPGPPPHFSQFSGPMRPRSRSPVSAVSPGKSRSTARPRRYRVSTGPSSGSRLSSLSFRLSPRTNTCPSGTVTGRSAPPPGTWAPGRIPLPAAPRPRRPYRRQSRYPPSGPRWRSRA